VGIGVGFEEGANVGLKLGAYTNRRKIVNKERYYTNKKIRKKDSTRIENDC
jgi:hypothetical protein